MSEAGKHTAAEISEIGEQIKASYAYKPTFRDFAGLKAYGGDKYPP